MNSYLWASYSYVAASLVTLSNLCCCLLTGRTSKTARHWLNYGSEQGWLYWGSCCILAFVWWVLLLFVGSVLKYPCGSRIVILHQNGLICEVENEVFLKIFLKDSRSTQDVILARGSYPYPKLSAPFWAWQQKQLSSRYSNFLNVYFTVNHILLYSFSYCFASSNLSNLHHSCSLRSYPYILWGLWCKVGRHLLFAKYED